MNLLIIGAPGVGKGTVSKQIVTDYSVAHISTGDMLREAVAKESEIGLQAKEFMNNGKLVPDSIIHDLIVERLKRDDVKQGFLFDGYPRNIAQAKDLDDLLQSLNLKIDSVINLEIEDEVLVKRITGRRVCPKCNAIYHIESQPSKVEGICDVCGEKLIQRADDTEESLIVRLQNFHSQTEPIIEYYTSKQLVKNINANDSIENVYSNVKKILEVIK